MYVVGGQVGSGAHKVADAQLGERSFGASRESVPKRATKLGKGAAHDVHVQASFQATVRDRAAQQRRGGSAPAQHHAC